MFEWLCTGDVQLLYVSYSGPGRSAGSFFHLIWVKGLISESGK